MRGERVRQGDGSWGLATVRRAGARYHTGAEVRGSTPARSCSQRWRSRAAGRTRRLGGDAGGAQGDRGRRLEPGGGLQGRRAGIHPRRPGTCPPTGGAREAAASAWRAPCLPGLPHQGQPLRARLLPSPAIPSEPASPAPPGAGLRSRPPFIATPRPWVGTQGGAKARGIRCGGSSACDITIGAWRSMTSRTLPLF